MNLRAYATILAPVLVITILSWLTLSSIGYASSLQRAVLFFVVGLALFVAASRLDESVFANTYLVLAFNAAIIGLLVFVILFGAALFGRSGWIRIGGISLQPSEFAKIAVLLNTIFLVRRKPLVYMGLLLVITGLVLKEPDLGSALLLAAFGFGTLFFFLTRRQKALFAAGVLVGLVFLALFLRGYQRERILTFFDPSRDPLGAGYNLKQLRISIGSGGLVGKGYMNGVEARYGFLPSAQTDFLLAAFLEEWGVMGWVMLLAAFAALSYQIWSFGRRVQNPYARTFFFSAFLLFCIQFLVNSGVNFTVLPIVGLPMPFFSYGGSQEIVHFAVLGILTRFLVRENEDRISA